MTAVGLLRNLGVPSKAEIASLGRLLPAWAAADPKLRVPRKLPPGEALGRKLDHIQPAA